LAAGSRAPPCLTYRARRSAAACASRGHVRLRRYCRESKAAAERRWAEPSSASRNCCGREQPSQRARARCSEEHRLPAASYHAIESRGSGSRRACRPSAVAGSGDLAARREVTDSVAIRRRSTWRSHPRPPSSSGGEAQRMVPDGTGRCSAEEWRGAVEVWSHSRPAPRAEDAFRVGRRRSSWCSLFFRFFSSLLRS
jgi:hypothetical protein